MIVDTAFFCILHFYFAVEDCVRIRGFGVKAVPNIISISRILLVPLFITLYFTDTSETKVSAVIVYAVAALSDMLDGFIARKFKATSNLGKFLDPLGDKLMIFSVLLCITIDGIIPIWAVLIVGIKELLMAIGGYFSFKKSGDEFLPSNSFGKISTVVFFAVCTALMLFRDIPALLATTLISVAIGFMLIALTSYIYTYFSVIKKGR